jgi:enoyl-CoA hydratase/carnithine racemase
MSERNLLFEREASIATITMNRPEKRNPFRSRQ